MLYKLQQHFQWILQQRGVASTLAIIIIINIKIITIVLMIIILIIAARVCTVQVHWQGKGWGYTTSHACIFPNLKISNIFHMQIGERGLNRPPPSLPPDFVLSAENESRESFIEDVFTGSICPVWFESWQGKFGEAKQLLSKAPRLQTNCRNCSSTSVQIKTAN